MADIIEAYKEVMSHWPSGVTVVTTRLDNQLYGMTVSAFTSVSLHPAMISVCIDKKAQMCEVLQQSKHLAVNILDHTQIYIAQNFANSNLKMSERFSRASLNQANTLSPVLENCLAWLDCQLHSFHDIGDHIIYVAEVLKTQILEQKKPVIYYRRGWYQVGEL